MPGKSRSNRVDGKLTGAFAIVAYPVEYRASGVTTFMVGLNGKAYQKDLGPETANIARSMTTFDPDSSWTLGRSTSSTPA